MLALVASPSSPEHVQLRDVSEPARRQGETIVRVRAISLNRGEVNRLAGAEDGARLGWDIAGVVEESPPDGGLPVGTRVIAFVLGGGWAQKVAVPNLRIAPILDDVSFATASSIPVAGLTALRMLRFGGLLLGRRVLVTGAAGGVGRFAIQLASAAGAKVTGVVGSAERGRGLKELGADEIVTDLAGLDPFDLILESVGGATLAAAMSLVKPTRTLVTFGNSSREETTINISNFYGRCAQMVGFSLLAPSQDQDFRADLEYLASLVSQKKLDPQIDLELPWTQAAEALTALRERRVGGKAVLRVEG
jgi:NADPH:quinone reductase-like Zn-dependent oxidoreductase